MLRCEIISDNCICRLVYKRLLEKYISMLHRNVFSAVTASDGRVTGQRGHVVHRMPVLCRQNIDLHLQ